MAVIRERIRAATNRRFTGRSVVQVAEEVSRVLRRWGQYYRPRNSARCFSAISRCAHERLARFASIKYGRAERNWQGRYDTAWLQSLVV
jgi:hypothetical protein